MISGTGRQSPAPSCEEQGDEWSCRWALEPDSKGFDSPVLHHPYIFAICRSANQKEAKNDKSDHSAKYASTSIFARFVV